MKSPGYHILAGAAFSRDEHGRVTLGYQTGHRAHAPYRRRDSEKSRQTVLRELFLLANPGWNAGSRPKRRSPLNLPYNLETNRIGRGRHDHGLSRVRIDGDHHDARVLLVHNGLELVDLKIRKTRIQQYQGRLPGIDLLECFGPA